MKKTIDKLADYVQSGSTFSDALALHPKIFNDLYVSMIRAGEVGGVLELVLTRLSEFQEKAARIRNKIISAMVYPLIVMTMAIGILCFLMVLIVPRFEVIFHDLLGVQTDAFQSLYHFTVGGPLEDHRLTTLAPYFHLEPRARGS